MDKITYLAVFEPTESGTYSVYFPDLPGCIGCGADYLKAYDDAAEALKMHLTGMIMADEDIPAASTDVSPDKDTAEDYIVRPVTVYIKPNIIDKAKDEIIKALKTPVGECVPEDKVKW